MTQDSPAYAHLREVASQLRTGKPGYATMTLDHLNHLRDIATGWLVAHPDNEEGLNRYDKLVEEIERRSPSNTSTLSTPATDPSLFSE